MIDLHNVYDPETMAEAGFRKPEVIYVANTPGMAYGKFSRAGVGIDPLRWILGGGLFLLLDETLNTPGERSGREMEVEPGMAYQTFLDYDVLLGAQMSRIRFTPQSSEICG